MAAIEMPTYAEMIDAYHRANELQKQLDETRRELANVRSHYSRLKRMYADLKGEKPRNTMQIKIIHLVEKGVDDYHAIATRAGCSYGYVRNVIMDYKRACKTTT